MEKIILKCRFITPAFIYGTTGYPEVRASSIKGLMRFWWRAAYLKSDNINKMRNDEVDIFGGKASNNKFQKAKISIYVLPSKTENGLNSELFSKKDEKDEKSDGDYLFYSMINLNQNKHYIKSGQEFSLIFRFTDKNKKYLVDYIRAFNILQLFGGIGGRSRRCGGNFVVTGVEAEDYIKELKENLYSIEWDDGSSLQSFYNKILLRKDLKANRKYSNIISNDCNVILYHLNENTNGYIDYLNLAGKYYKESREEFKGNTRRGSSPLIIKIVQDRNGFNLLIVKLSGEFSKEESNITDILISKLVNNENGNREFERMIINE